ncbi:uncharacterized protein SPAPADRAFT_56141 [Spathaspora passalidarum NRRL Y-27907]|uniref:Uncharacterized protein n=1 Tax=Spathaspora passalidarum (strain NRRL Y-27907 / 11-Y1) TaxID=619300 RepID=G3AR82_SPAPN|nr:uncharacterized protein SPAPADRAFT_56141 [Spathaspora passalidarum NRRL Y-27907]EGW31257.1 hypothetical protein SPAPADRAFT_56141 [Spathaspora passalidarum NRRL Y-27907]
MFPVSLAIIGLNGALTRQDTPSTDKIQYIKTEINSETVDSIAESLASVDVIAELVASNPVLFATLEKVADKVEPKLYIPSQFGSDFEVVNKILPGFLQFKVQHTANLRSLGLKTVDVITNYFAKPGAFLYEHVTHVGIDPNDNTVFQIGDLDTKLSFTRVEDIGSVVAAVATTPVDKLPNTVKVQSGVISYKELIEIYEAKHNVKLTIKEKITKEEGKKLAKEKLNAGFNPKDFTFYLHVLGAYGLEYDINHNELLNPNESVWKWQKYYILILIYIY